MSSSTYDDDVAYARDLGLVVLDPELQVTNPIYREVIARVLGDSIQGDIRVRPEHFLSADGTLDIAAILTSFASFWREHGAVLTGSLLYHEVAPQLVVMAYLQSIVNGTGFIDREYGVGHGRIDLHLRWPYEGADGARTWQCEAIELTVWRDKKPDPKDEGLAQLDTYLDKIALDNGVLLIFDRRTKPSAEAAEASEISAPPEGPALSETKSPRGRDVLLLRA